MRKLLLICALLLSLVSCMNEQKRLSHAPVHRILVVHSYDSTMRQYSVFNDEVKKTFASEGINAELRHIYVESFRSQIFIPNIRTFGYLAAEEGWEPELILTDGDIAAKSLFYEPIIPYKKAYEVPVVM